MLIAVTADESAHSAIADSGARSSRSRYGWPRIAAATLDVYARVTGGEGASVPRRRSAGARHFAPMPDGREHCEALQRALGGLQGDVERVEEWGRRLAEVLADGGRLLAVGNGGSAAEAQHLTAELVGRYRDERQPLSAICLHGDTSSLTAIANDYGAEEAFARQVRAHGRRGDVLIAFSTSGRSANLVRAAQAAKELEMTAWALTGGASSPLADACDEALQLGGESSATTQELHLVALHVLCGAVDRELALRSRPQGHEAERRRSHARPRIGSSERRVRRSRGAVR